MTAGREPPGTELVRNPDVGETPVEGDVFLAGPDGGRIHYLNQVAAGVWTMLESPHKREDIKAVVRDAFPEVAPARIEADVDSVLDTLLARGLIRLRG